MTQTNFANYLKYLPFDEREKLIAMRNQAYGIKSEQDKKTEVKVETTTAPTVENNAIYQSNPIYEKLLNFRNLQEQQKKKFSVAWLLRFLILQKRLLKAQNLEYCKRLYEAVAEVSASESFSRRYLIYYLCSVLVCL